MRPRPRAPRLAAPRRRPRRIARAGCCRRPSRGRASAAAGPRRSAPATRPGRRSARSTLPASRRPLVGSARRRSSDAIVVLPLPVGPTSATVSPGASSTSTASSTSPSRAGYANETFSSRTGASLGRGGRASPRAAAGPSSRRSSRRVATARPSALAWYCAARFRSGRYSSGASTSTVRPASKPTPPSTRRTPTVTATRAMPRVAASSSTVPERNATRSVPIVARRYSSATRSICSTWAGPRLNARSVGSPRTTSRKCVASRASARRRSCARRSV